MFVNVYVQDTGLKYTIIICSHVSTVIISVNLVGISDTFNRRKYDIYLEVPFLLSYMALLGIPSPILFKHLIFRLMQSTLIRL